MRTVPIAMLALAALIASNGGAETAPLPACSGPAMRLVHYETVAIEHSQSVAGDVIVEFTVDASGQVTDPKILNASDARLEDYALRSATLWRYVAPATPCRHRMQVLFSLELLP
jgi:TonB family protein